MHLDPVSGAIGADLVSDRKGRVASSVVSPDGKRLASGSYATWRCFGMPRPAIWSEASKDIPMMSCPSLSRPTARCSPRELRPDDKDLGRGEWKAVAQPRSSVIRPIAVVLFAGWRKLASGQDWGDSSCGMWRAAQLLHRHQGTTITASIPWSSRQTAPLLAAGADYEGGLWDLAAKKESGLATRGATRSFAASPSRPTGKPLATGDFDNISGCGTWRAAHSVQAASSSRLDSESLFFRPTARCSPPAATMIP